MAPYIYILETKIENRVVKKGMGGGWLGPLGPLGGLGIGVGKKYSAHPLEPTQLTPMKERNKKQTRDRFLGPKWLIGCSPST